MSTQFSQFFDRFPEVVSVFLFVRGSRKNGVDKTSALRNACRSATIAVKLSRLSGHGSACAHKGGEGDADIRVAEMIPATGLEIFRPQWRKPEGPRQQTSKLSVPCGKYQSTRVLR